MLDYEVSIQDKEIIEACFYVVKNYVNNNKQIDKVFFEELGDIVKYVKKIEEYVKEISINNRLKDMANYYVYSKKIEFNLKKFLIRINQDKNLFNNEDYQMYLFLRATMLLFHELEHANQRKIIRENNDLESLIIITSTKKHFDLFEKSLYINKSHFIRRMILNEKLYNCKYIYKKYYAYAPEERLANIKSHFISLKLSEMFQNEYLYTYINMFFYVSCLEGYFKKLNPTQFYISKMEPNFDWDIIKKLSDELDLNSRVKFGLEISKEECSKIKNELFSNVKKIKEMQKKLTK